MRKPLAIELFAGLHGWGEGFVAEGYDVVGFDIVDMCRELDQPRPSGVQLVLQDVLTLHGSQFNRAAVIVASSPCQEFSYYHRFPWKAPEPRLGIDLFRAAFRIAEEAGVPLVAENVVGAQRWVGRAGWHHGSYYLWGDVPALMPRDMPKKGFGQTFEDTPAAWFSSRSKQRKAWSAQIAKIPFPLSQHIARVFKP